MGEAYFSSEVLKDSSTVHSCCGSYTTMAGCASLQVPVDTTHWELPGNRLVGVKQSRQTGARHITLKYAAEPQTQTYLQPSSLGA